MKYRTGATLGLCVGLFSAMIPSKAQRVMQVEEAVSIGLENNFDVRIVENLREIQENNYRPGNAGFAPVITVNGGRSYTLVDVSQEFINGSTNEANGAKSNNWIGALNLDWTIFDGTRMFKTYQKLGQLVQLGKIQELEQVEFTVQDVVLGYNQIVLEKNRVAALDSNMNLSRERLEISRSNYEVGKGAKSEFLSAQVDFNSDSSLLLKQIEVLTKTKTDFNKLLARDVDIEFEVPNSIEIDSGLVFDELWRDAQERNKQVLAAKKNFEIASLAEKEIVAERMPSIGVNLAYTYTNLNSEAGFLLSNRTNGLNYGVSANWLLFNGSDVNRRVQNARIDRENSQIEIERATLDLKALIRNTYLEYQNSLTLVRLEQQNLDVALENARIALDRYRVGHSSFIELRDAQVNGVQAFGRLINAIYDAKVAETELLRLSGRLVN